MIEAKIWIDRISKAKKEWQKYHDLIKEIREYYRNKKANNKQNIFWSSIETLKPFIYFKAPVPYVERKSKVSNPVEDAACVILEKALIQNLETQDFDGVIKYARNDYLLSGLGLTFEKYVPTFKTVETLSIDEQGNAVAVQADVLESAKVETTYLDPQKLIFDCSNVSVWEDCEWVAQEIEMAKKDVIDQFGEEVASKILDGTTDLGEELERPTSVYRIWDKKDGLILYVSKEYRDDYLRVDQDILKIEGFYPFAKPVFATLANDGLIPVPDYSEIKCQLDELDGINSRMKLTMQAIKVSGAYDGSFPELANILDKDVSLVSVSDFEKIREKGGIAGLVNFMPIGQYIEALQALAERRAQLMNAIYEITGVSDIMRGNSDPNETATAVTQKTNFGTLRNQDRQNDFQRFLTDILKIKAEIICEMFTPEMLSVYADQNTPIEIVTAAIDLLKTDKIRNLLLGIETDVSFTQSGEAEKALSAVKTIHELVTSSFEVISAQPALLPLYKQMVQSVVVTLPNTRQFTAAIDETFSRIEAELSQPDEKDESTSPDMIRAQADMMRAQAEQMKNANELQVKQQANAIKEQEVQLKKQAEDNKVMMANKEAEMQYALKQEELARQGQTNENITTGFVGAF